MSIQFIIQKGQIYEDKLNPLRRFKVLGKAKNDKWKLVELTEKHNVFGVTHSFNRYIIRQRLRLITGITYD